jgi:hypothetical protein
MSETNSTTNATTTTNGTTAKVYATAEEARAAGKPAGHDKWKLYETVSPEGLQRYVYADVSASALRVAALAAGWRVTSLDAKPPTPLWWPACWPR